MIVDKILAYLSEQEVSIDDWTATKIGHLAKYAFQRQFMDEKKDSGELRLSSAGKCPRALAYKLHNFEPMGKEIDGRARVIFFQGDVVELTILGLAKIAGCAVTAYGMDQMRVYLDIGGTRIAGHPDGLLFEEGCHYLVEVKSMNKDAYERFEKGMIDEGYIAQINAYLDALGLEKCVMVALNKNSGVMTERVITKDYEVLNSIKKNLLQVLLSTKEILPERPYAPNDQGILPWNCLYCAYWKHCWPTAEKVLVRNSYKLKQPITVEASQ